MVPVRKYDQNWLPNWFDDFFDNEWMRKANATAPAINVLVNEQQYEVEVAAPGMTKDDFKIHVDADNNLVIEMEKQQENKTEGDEKAKARYLRREFSYTKFSQTLILPEDVDKQKIGANVENGVLHITLPKLTPEQKQETLQQIEVK